MNDIVIYLSCSNFVINTPFNLFVCNTDFFLLDLELEKHIFENWEQEDTTFIPTTALEEVEDKIKCQNLVIVLGSSGSGKSAIIQHIALEYRRLRWIVKPVKGVNEICKAFLSANILGNKTIFVLNDPIGKESLDEIRYHSWQTYENALMSYLKSVKILITCRNCILSDYRVSGFFRESSYIIDIDNERCRLDASEKRLFLNKYIPDVGFSNEEKANIAKTENYFPILCRIYSSKFKCKRLDIFEDHVEVLKKEIKKNKETFCALVLLALSNNDLCLSKMSKENKQCALKLAEIETNISLEDVLYSMIGHFVKQIGDRYQFYHDLVMEVTTYILGTEYPEETIKAADIGFLRRRVRFKECSENNGPFTIYLKDRHANDLGKRLFADIYKERFLDVVLNPSIRNEKVIKVFIKKLKKQPQKLKTLGEKQELKIEEHDFQKTSEHFLWSKLAFVCAESKISPLCALIVYCHVNLSLFILEKMKQLETNPSEFSLFCAVCCNDSTQLLSMFSDDIIRHHLKKKYKVFYPIHIASAFHNSEVLKKMIDIGADVNLKTDDTKEWCPLILAAGNSTDDNLSYHKGFEDETRRNDTIKLLLNKGAKINSCTKDGISSLYIACQNGHYKTVQLLLHEKADVNSCNENGACPLLIACHNGHENIVNLLINSRALVNMCKKNKASPLYTACKKGHCNIVEILLKNKADISFCKKNGASPLFVACRKGFHEIVKVLHRNGANINLFAQNRTSSLCIACQNGHDKTVQELLSTKKADINLPNKNGASPLYKACQNGHYKIVEQLLNVKADINLCKQNGASPLCVACEEGHEDIVKLLLKNKAKINAGDENGINPLFTACERGHGNIAHILLDKGAIIDLCDENGISPLYIACQNGHDSIVELLLDKKANKDICQNNGTSALFIACKKKHCSTVKLLLKHQVQVNSDNENSVSPLLIACQNGDASIVRLLLRKNAKVDQCDQQGICPLFAACKNGHEGVVKLLLEYNADVNKNDENGISPLLIACRGYNIDHDNQYEEIQNGYDNIIQLLLKNKAKVNSCDKNGTTPLYTACQEGHNSFVKYLLAAEDIDINLCNNTGVSPIFTAYQNGHKEVVTLLLKKGANVNFMMEKE